MQELKKITIKELSQKMAISRTNAQLLLQDIKKEYEIKIVTMSHVIHYLKIPHPINI